MVPKGWSMAFLDSFLYTGTRVAGQRERQHQFFESGIPYFPRDFPVTKGYGSFADGRALEEKTLWEKKPPAKRPSWGKLGTRSPWKPDWDVVLGISPISDNDIDMVPTQRDVADPMMKEGKSWLLQGVNVRTILDEASKMLDPAGSLLRQINTLRFKRGMELLGSETNAEVLFQGALVRVKVTLVDRGVPADMAIIYALDNAEITEWRIAQSTNRMAIEESDNEGNSVRFRTNMVPQLSNNQRPGIIFFGQDYRICYQWQLLSFPRDKLCDRCHSSEDVL